MDGQHGHAEGTQTGRKERGTASKMIKRGKSKQKDKTLGTCPTTQLI